MRHAAFLLLAACASSAKPAPSGSSPSYEALRDAVVQHLHALDPGDATALGLHEFDGKLPDRSPAAQAST